MEDFDRLLKIYNKDIVVLSPEQVKEMKINFIFHSNRLEGSNLSLSQTDDVISNTKVKGDSSVVDILMALDHYKALNQAIDFGLKKYPLSKKMLLSLHHTLLKNSFNVDEFYDSWKLSGQELGKFKIKHNRILIIKDNKQQYYNTPSAEMSENLIEKSIDIYNNSEEHIVVKLAKLLQNIFNAHAFFDGNKRMTRLLIANQLYANGFDLMIAHENKNEYNAALVDGFLNKTEQPIQSVLLKYFKQYLAKEIEMNEQVKKATKSEGINFGLII